MGDSDSDSQPLNRCISMFSSNYSKRKRTARATTSQIEALLSKLEAQPFLASKRFPVFQGGENSKFEAGWKEVAELLNGFPNGSVKMPEQWMTVWRDIKSRACLKAAKLNKEKSVLGKRHLNSPSLSDVEKRIVSLVCSDYTVDPNASCPNSVPEKHVMRQEFEDMDTPQSSEMEMTNSNDWPLPTLTVEVPPAITSTDSHERNNEDEMTNRNDTPAMSTVADTSSVISSTAQTPQIKSEKKPNASSENVPVQIRTNRRLHFRRRDHNSVQKHFLSLAKSNAKSMRMLANATSLQAEVAKMQAEAIKAQVEATKAQAEAYQQLAHAANKIGEALLSLANKK